MARPNNAAAPYSRRQWIGFISSVPLFLLLLLLPTPAGLSEAGQVVLSAAVLMALLWITEAIPIAATALLPLVLFPLLKVDTFGNVAKSYAHSNIFLFMGGFILATAIQKWGLHRRIALRLILLIGTNPRRIVLGFMVATAFLSMWISNTATTMMMYPIGLAVIAHFIADRRANGDPEGVDSMQNLQTVLMLAIAYAASVGGIGTLIGTPPNIVFAAAMTKLFPGAPEITFVQWIGIGLPLVLIFLPLIWILLTRVIFKIGTDDSSSGRELIRAKYQELGPMQRPEKIVAWVFFLTALAWITRGDIKLGSVVLTGWASLLGISKTVNDATVAMAASLVLFSIPVSWRRGEFLLDWESARDIPWGILLLFGGGIALAGGFVTSGLATWIGRQLEHLGTLPVPLLILSIAFMVTFLTEITSNTATTTLLMPVLASLALAMHTHPLLLMIPATISASCAFMLPVATPPNAIVFGSGYISIPQMAKAGVLLNFVGMFIVTLLVYAFGIPLFSISLSQMPAWVQ